MDARQVSCFVDLTVVFRNGKVSDSSRISEGTTIRVVVPVANRLQPGGYPQPPHRP